MPIRLPRWLGITCWCWCTAASALGVAGGIIGAVEWATRE